MVRLAAIVAVFAHSAPAQNPCSVSAVGFQIVTFGAVRVAVWYPSTTPEARYSYSDRLAGSLALNGAPNACTRWPMVVFSHGHGGCATQSVFITEQLARRGYVVAAPDHADATCSAAGTASGDPAVSQAPFLNPESWTDQTYANRRADVVNTMNSMLASPVFGGMIDASKIAGMGHSLGGYTILGLVGGWSSWVEPRIKAAVLLSPYSQPYLTHDGLGGIRVPAQYQGGTLDLGVTPWIEKNSGAYDQTPPSPSKFFLNLRAAGHFVWTNSTCSQYGAVVDCLRSSANARMINDYAFDFLDRYLRGSAAPLLWEQGTGLADYRRESAVWLVNAAGFQSGSAAPNSIATLYSEGFAESLPPAGTAAPDPLRPPASLAGVQVSFTDSAGANRAASLYYVSPTQINAVVPAGLAAGAASVAIRNGDATRGRGSFNIAPVAPGIFYAAIDGRTLAVGQVLYGGSRITTSLIAAPVDLSSGDAYLILYGTGLRAAAGSVRATIGGVAVPVLHLVPQPEFPGLDQFALGPLPQSLAGSGLATIEVNAGGQTSNGVSVRVQ